MNRFIISIVFAGLFATQFAPTAIFAQTQPQSFSSQLISVQVLKALLKAASAAPVFTTARRVKAPDEKDVATAAEMLARDVETALRSVNVIETLRAEKDGVLGATRTVASPSFIAEELTRQFAPKPVPAKRASALDGVVAVANAGDIPTDAEIQEAEAKVKDAELAVQRAKNNLREAEKTGNKEVIAEEKAELAKAREELDKAKAKVGELKLKQGIAESVSNCTFNANTRYGVVQSYAVGPMINMLLLRVGELIGNPYYPEEGQFSTRIDRGRNGNLSPGERVAAGNSRVGISEGYEALFLFKLAQELEAAGRSGDVKSAAPTIRRAFEDAIVTKSSYDIIWKVLGPHAKREFEKRGILNNGGLVDALDYFLKIQRQLLKDDVTPLKALIDGAEADIKREVQKLEAVLRATERQVGKKLGDIGMGSGDMQAQLDAMMGAYLDCGSNDRLDELLYFVKTQIYNKIYDAIKKAILDSMVVKNEFGDVIGSGLINGTDVVVGGAFKDVHTAFRDAVSGDITALTGLQKAATVAAGEWDLLEGAKRRLMLRFSILLLRNVQDYAEVQNKLLKDAWGRTLNTMVETDGAEVRGILDQVKFLSEDPNLIALRTLLYAIDEFVRRFKEIVAGIEGLSKTGLKAGYCELKTRIDERERQKEEAMKEIEKRAEDVKKQVGQQARENALLCWNAAVGSDGYPNRHAQTLSSSCSNVSIGYCQKTSDATTYFNFIIVTDSSSSGEHERIASVCAVERGSADQAGCAEFAAMAQGNV